MRETCLRILFSIVVVGLWSVFILATNPCLHRLFARQPTQLSPPASPVVTGTPRPGQHKQPAKPARSSGTVSKQPAKPARSSGTVSKQPAKPARSSGTVSKQPAKPARSSGTVSKVWQPLFCFQHTITALAGDSRRSLLAIGCENGAIYLWDIEKNEKIKELHSHTRRINALEFGQHGNYLVSGSDDRTLINWDIETGDEYQTLDCNSPVVAVAIANNGKQLLAGCRNNYAYLYRESLGREIPLGHRAPVSSVAFWREYAITCPLAEAQRQCHFKIWNIAAAKPVYEYPFTGKFVLIAGSALILAWQQTQIHRFDCASRRWYELLTLSFAIDIVAGCDDGNLLAMAGGSNDILCYHCHTKKLLAKLALPLERQPGRISLIFAGKSQRLFLASGKQIYASLRQFSSIPPGKK